MIEFAVRRPVAVVMICIGLIVVGIISAKRIPVQLMPNILTPEFSIIVDFKGATPEEIETLVTVPIERTVSTVPGLYKMTSISNRERAEIRLNFKSSINYLETVSAVRERLDAAGLPEAAGRPKIVRYQANAAPVVRLALIPTDEKADRLEISRVLRDLLIRKLESIDGVAIASLVGQPDKQIEIVVNPTAVQNYGISITSLPDSIQSHNRSYPAGDIEFEGKRSSIKLGLGLSSIEELRRLIVKKDGDKVITLNDIAQIHENVTKPSVRPHLGGVASFVVEVRKEAEANTVQVADKAKEVITAFLEENREQIKGQILFDQGHQIEIAIDNVAESVFHGGVLAGLVIFVLLQNWWPTFVVSLSMPISILMTFMLMYFTGITFNLMSLAGLALGVGMLVDNSTIVLDNIHLLQGKMDDNKMAAYWGTKTVVGAITGSTLATMAVFAPLAFVEGTIGQMFRDVAATVCYSLAASLFSAVFLIPMLSSVQFKPKPKDSRSGPKNGLMHLLAQSRTCQFYRAPNDQGGNFIYSWRTILEFYKKSWFFFKLSILLMFELGHIYLVPAFTALGVLIVKCSGVVFNPALNWVSTAVYKLENLLKTGIPEIVRDSRKVIVWSVGLTLLGLLFLINRGAELFPDETVDHLVYEMEFTPGQTIEVTEDKVTRIEKSLLGIPGVVSVSSSSGEGGAHRGTLGFQVNEKQSGVINQKISRVLALEPGLVFNRTKEAMVGEGKPVQIEIYNEDLGKLKEQVGLLKGMVAEVPGLVDIETDIKPDISEVNIQFAANRLSWFGTDAMAFVSLLRAMLMGQDAGQLQFKGDEIAARVVVPFDYFSSIDKLRYISIPQEEDKRIYLNQVSEVKDHRILGSIKRLNRKRMAVISGNVSGTDLETVSKKIRSVILAKFKEGTLNWKLGGQDEERERSQKSLIVAVVMSIFLIYLMLAGQFENLIQPIIILCAVPFCISGVAAFLLLFNLNVSALVFVGFIILVGVSVNTSIVMVDFANQMVTEGKPIHEAIAEATVRRMRPILVTTLSGILGLVPMALAIGQGSAMQQPLAVTMIGGHISATVLTILVIPVVYAKLAKVAKIDDRK